jgi:hypothetical protein
VGLGGWGLPSSQRLSRRQWGGFAEAFLISWLAEMPVAIFQLFGDALGVAGRTFWSCGGVHVWCSYASVPPSYPPTTTMHTLMWKCLAIDVVIKLSRHRLEWHSLRICQRSRASACSIERRRWQVSRCEWLFALYYRSRDDRGFVCRSVSTGMQSAVMVTRQTVTLMM